MLVSRMLVADAICSNLFEYESILCFDLSLVSYTCILRPHVYSFLLFACDWMARDVMISSACLVAVECPELSSVDNSDLTSAVTLTTTGTQTVACNDGYATAATNGETNFIVICEASGAGASALSGEQSCVGACCLYCYVCLGGWALLDDG